MTLNQNELAGWIGRTLVDDSGDKIGKIVDLYADEATGQPEWIAVNTGRLGSNINFVPLAGATQSGGDLRVPYTNDQVTDAPNATPDGQLSQDEEARLYRHYGMDYSEDRSPSGLPETGGKTRKARGDGRSRTKGRDTSGPTTDDAMTRSEEELRVDKESREAGRARLRKYVVTEEETRTVPVTREKVRVEREPITDANIGEAHGRARHLRRGARGRPARGAAGGDQGDRPQGAGPARHRERHRGPRGHRRGAQGAHRG